MDAEAVVILTDALKEYFNNEREFQEFCDLYDINVEFYEFNTIGVDSTRIDYVKMARKLIIESEFGNNRRFLDALVPSLITRCKKYIAQTQYQNRSYHEDMLPRLDNLQLLKGSPKLREELTVPEDHPFSAKSEVRGYLDEAKTEVTIVDTYIGVGTLDCIRGLVQPVRIITAERSGSIEQGFDSAVKDFRQEGGSIEIRQHRKIHDRFIIFNNRCWLVGGSLKDAGKKTFNMILLSQMIVYYYPLTQTIWIEP